MKQAVKLNHIEDADMKTLRSIANQLGNGYRMGEIERRNISNLIFLILDRIVPMTVDEDEMHAGHG